MTVINITVVRNRYVFSCLLTIIVYLFSIKIFAQHTNKLIINDQDYFETQGLNVLVFSNWYDGNFSDAKISSVELIHHGIRTATNGDVRLMPTPGQWDATPQFVERKIDKEENSIEAFLSYPDFEFNYSIKVTADGEGFLISVNIENPLPATLEGKAGLNFEFIPSAYFEKSFLMDGKPYVFPLYPSGPTVKSKSGLSNPLPLASGNTLAIAPEDPERNILIKAQLGSLSIYDGRNQAQNGWFVVRTLIPSGTTGKVVEWFVKPNTIDDWIRKPMISYSQLGYHPDQKKIAVFEFDKNDEIGKSAKLLKVNEDGTLTEILNEDLKSWGDYLRYKYSTYDFSRIKESGVYVIEYDTIRTSAFRIDKDIYKTAWHPTMDVFFPVQMDHMFVNEAYRVWHGAAHLDDALQAPVNHEHFDLYAQGPTTDTPFKPGEHIPGLNVGGWFDAGDYDIRTQTQYYVVQNLVHVWETFKLSRDETTINQNNRFVDMHKPDGKPDLLQQIEHGTIQLLAQHKAVGHAINGIIVPDLSQYTHLGDAVTMTDNLIYNPNLDSLESDGLTSGTFDDRWAFTNKSSALNFGSIAALAAASRALKNYNDKLSEDCLRTAVDVWDDEHSHEPDTFRHGNTTGGQLKSEELKAVVELLITTGEKKYSERLNELIPSDGREFLFNAGYLINAIPFMDDGYSNKIEELVKNYSANLNNFLNENPFGVPITRGGWAGGGLVVGFALNNYLMHKAFPNLIDRELVFNGLNYIYGYHPGSNYSLVSGVGTVSKKVAYGNNRADFSFIAGGIVPGVLILKPDFPENKEDWPFFWGENEYVISLGSSYLYLVNAADELLNGSGVTEE